jgi:hypothetical protein
MHAFRSHQSHDVIRDPASRNTSQSCENHADLIHPGKSSWVEGGNPQGPQAAFWGLLSEKDLNEVIFFFPQQSAGILATGPGKNSFLESGM